MTIRVAVADDHTLVREGLRALLDTVDGVELVSAVPSSREAVRTAVTEMPDVLVLDINLPDGSGIDVAQEHIFGKLQVASRAEAIVKARDAGPGT